MPRIARRTIARHEDVDSPRVRFRLIAGHDFQFLDGPAPDYDLSAAWAELRSELMAAWHTGTPIPDAYDEKGTAGERPAAWWTYDAPGRRRVVEGTEQNTGDDRTFFGVPAIARGLVEYESQAEFLDRHDLLTDAERAALATVGAPQ